MKLELHRTLCISNSGFRLNLKKMNINKGKCLSEKLVYFNPLLLIHKTVRHKQKEKNMKYFQIILTIIILCISCSNEKKTWITPSQLKKLKK